MRHRKMNLVQNAPQETNSCIILKCTAAREVKQSTKWHKEEKICKHQILLPVITMEVLKPVVGVSRMIQCKDSQVGENYDQKLTVYQTSGNKF